MTDLVYIIDRDGELDVYASRLDAEEAAEILGGAEIIEQVVFAETSSDISAQSTRAWLDGLRDEAAPVVRCGCEASYCEHTRDLRSCDATPNGSITMDYVGPVCEGCAQTIRANGGGQYLHEVER